MTADFFTRRRGGIVGKLRQEVWGRGKMLLSAAPARLSPEQLRETLRHPSPITEYQRLSLVFDERASRWLAVTHLSGLDLPLRVQLAAGDPDSPLAAEAEALHMLAANAPPLADGPDPAQPFVYLDGRQWAACLPCPDGVCGGFPITLPLSAPTKHEITAIDPPQRSYAWSALSSRARLRARELLDGFHQDQTSRCPGCMTKLVRSGEIQLPAGEALIWFDVITQDWLLLQVSENGSGAAASLGIDGFYADEKQLMEAAQRLIDSPLQFATGTSH
jgi:hypothetical protein